MCMKACLCSCSSLRTPSDGKGLSHRKFGVAGKRSEASSKLCSATPLDCGQILHSAQQSANLVYTIASSDVQAAGAAKAIFGPLCSVGQLLMIVRIVLTWYPEIDQEKFPWFVACAPTEPILGPTRKLIPPAFGVDISPIVWVGLLSLTNEIFLGPQGILSLVEKQG